MYWNPPLTASHLIPLLQIPGCECDGGPPLDVDPEQGRLAGVVGQDEGGLQGGPGGEEAAGRELPKLEEQ